MPPELSRDPEPFPPLPDRERGSGGEGAHTEAIDHLLAHYGWRRTSEPALVPNSVLNRNYRVETTGGTFFVRAHKPTRQRERLDLEHEVIRRVAGRGVPVNPPIPDADGVTLHEIGGQFFAIFPWLDGVTRAPGPGDFELAALLGETHGRLHAALRDYPRDGLPTDRAGIAWDTAESFAILRRLDTMAEAPDAEPGLLEARPGIREQLALLDSGVARAASDFDWVPRQAVHGDYHERNVVLTPSGDAVLAVVDWEAVGLLPPAYEVIQALTFILILDDARLEAYVAGYARHFRATPDDWRTAVEMWWQTTLHHTWVLRARFIEGNTAVERFLPEKLPRLRSFADPAYRERLGRRLIAACG